MIKINVEGQKMSFQNTVLQRLEMEDAGITELSFKFSSDWNSVLKTVVFYRSPLEYKTYLLLGNKTQVPQDYRKHPGVCFYLSRNEILENKKKTTNYLEIDYPLE